jgi:hypothetical protein
VHQCRSDADCLLDGQDQGFDCVDGECKHPDGSCTNDEQCIAFESNWMTPCTSGGNECDVAGQVCVAVTGAGRCAFPPSTVSCTDLTMEEMQLPDIDGNLITVCGFPCYRCAADGYCLLPCQDDSICINPAYPVCNMSTGLCECGQDSDCALLGQPASSVCTAGVCGCGSDQECLDAGTGDVCLAGFCGCTGDMACEGVNNPWDGGMLSCVEV